jgi:hypothetical protein
LSLRGSNTRLPYGTSTETAKARRRGAGANAHTPGDGKLKAESSKQATEIIGIPSIPVFSFQLLAFSF